MPTQVPLAVLPTEPPPTATTLPPTLDFTLLNPTQEPTAAPTQGPTATATPVQPFINISTPKKETTIVVGTVVSVRGLIQLEPDQVVVLALVSSNGRLLATTPGIVGEIGWDTELQIPENVSGIAYLQASIRDQNGAVITSHQIPVKLTPNLESSRYLNLFRPLEDETAVAGFNMFFDGRAEQPAANTVTIAIWADDCQTQVARQSFVLRGSGYWQGFVVVPTNISGPGCAIASFGSPDDEETWREVQLPIDILPITDPDAKGVHIGNPPPDSTFIAGQELLLYGTALNISEGEIQVRILLENGRILQEIPVSTDYWGYWELPIILPFDVEGPAKIMATAGELGDENYTEIETVFLIEPAPTPTPGPPPTIAPTSVGN